MYIYMRLKTLVNSRPIGFYVYFQYFDLASNISVPRPEIPAIMPGVLSYQTRLHYRIKTEATSPPSINEDHP
jgi:hypothetical protein